MSGAGQAQGSITPKDVEKAFFDLLLDGQNPTLEKIRHNLGRGSPNTIIKYRKELLEKMASSRSMPLPAPIPESAATLMAQLWGMISAEAYGKFTEEINRCNEAMATSKREAEIAIANANAEAAKKIEDAESRLRQANTHTDALLADSTKKDLRIGHLVGRVEALESENVELSNKLKEAIDRESKLVAEIKAEAEARISDLKASHRSEMAEEVARRKEAIDGYKSTLIKEGEVSAQLAKQLDIANERYSKDTARLMQQLDSANQDLKSDRKALELAGAKIKELERNHVTEIANQKKLMADSKAEIEEKSVMLKNASISSILAASRLVDEKVSKAIVKDFVNQCVVLDLIQGDLLLADHAKKVIAYIS